MNGHLYDSSSNIHNINKLLENEIIGGVILFDHNYDHVEQTISLIDSIKSINNNILIAVDHEGGRVQRFREAADLHTGHSSPHESRRCFLVAVPPCQ